MTPVGLKRAAQRHRQMIWLVTHANLVREFDYSDEDRKALFDLMQHKGLFSIKSKWHDADMVGMVRKAAQILAERNKLTEMVKVTQEDRVWVKRLRKIGASNSEIATALGITENHPLLQETT